jgi:hypothetical protein
MFIQCLVWRLLFHLRLPNSRDNAKRQAANDGTAWCMKLQKTSPGLLFTQAFYNLFPKAHGEAGPLLPL